MFKTDKKKSSRKRNKYIRGNRENNEFDSALKIIFQNLRCKMGEERNILSYIQGFR